MSITETPELDGRLTALLAAEGLPELEAALPALSRYVELVRHWNLRASLVSEGDANRLWEVHLPDALSLAGILMRALAQGVEWVDVGSGGGLPAIPVRILCGELPLTLCERSLKKSGVLREMLNALSLSGVNLINGEFPRELPHGANPVVLTARAVEKPSLVHGALSKWMRSGDLFLCQSSEVALPLRGKMFHVELCEDAWTWAALRRGKLWLVRRT